MLIEMIVKSCLSAFEFLRKTTIVVVLCVSLLEDFAFGQTDQVLIDLYNTGRYDRIQTELLNIGQGSTINKLYLLYKILSSKGEYVQARRVLLKLKERLPSELKVAAVFNEIDLAQKSISPESLIDQVSQLELDRSRPILEKVVKQLIITTVSEHGKKVVTKKSLEKILTIFNSYTSDIDILTIYRDSLKSGDPAILRTKVRIWEMSDVSTQSTSFLREVGAIVLKSGEFAGSVVEHFKRQYFFKNFTYIVKYLPTYVVTVREKDSDTYFIDLRKTYLRTLARKRRYTKLIDIYSSKEKRAFWGMSKSDALLNRISIWLRMGKSDQAVNDLNYLIKHYPTVDLNEKFVELATYYYRKDQYRKSLKIFGSVKITALPKPSVPGVYWKLFRIYQKMGNREGLNTVSRWAKTYPFENSEVAARFCYWGYKLGLYPKDNRASCGRQYPFTYYGLHSENIGRSVEESTRFFQPFVKESREKLDEKERQLIRFLELLYTIHEIELADDIFSFSTRQGRSVYFLRRVLDVLLRARRYHLIQTTLYTHYLEMMKGNPSLTGSFLRYFYPLAHNTEVGALTRKTRVPKLLVLAIMREESHFDEKAESVAGAIGLMQLMRGTARYIGKTIRLKTRGRDLSEVSINLTLGVAYLRRLMRRYNGNMFYTVAAYNGGPTNVRRWRRAVKTGDIDYFVEDIRFNETQNYVRRVMRSFYIYQKIYTYAGIK